MLAFLNRIQFSSSNLGHPAFPFAFRATDDVGNPCLYIDVPMLFGVDNFYGRFTNHDHWYWTGAGGPGMDEVEYYSHDGRLLAGIPLRVLGLDADRIYEQMHDSEVRTLTADVVLRLAEWIEPTAGALEGEQPMQRFGGVPGRRHLTPPVR